MLEGVALYITRLSLLISVMVASAHPTPAAPDRFSNLLMDSSLSMMDWGIFRLEQRLSNNTSIKAPTGVHYNWDDDEIIIRAFSYDPDEEEAEAKGKCAEWFKEVRLDAGVSEETGMLRFGSYSVFAGLFGNMSFERPRGDLTEPELLSEIDKKIKLEHTRGVASDEASMGLLTCRGDLIDNGLSTEIK